MDFVCFRLIRFGSVLFLFSNGYFESSKIVMESCAVIFAAAEQFNGREGETATFLSRCFVSLNLRVGGFAPRHLSRWRFVLR